MKIKILTREHTERILKMRDVIAAVEVAYEGKARGDSSVFPIVCHEFESGISDMDIKSGDIKEIGAFGLKMVSYFGRNPEQGLPALTGVVMMFDDRTGLPLGIINAGYMTGMRTGAAGAVGIKYLSRPDSERMLMVGAGGQAAFQIRGALTVRPDLKWIGIYSPNHREKAEALVRELQKELRGGGFAEKSDGGPGTMAERRESLGQFQTHPQLMLEVVSDLEEAVSHSDIIVTATASRKPLIHRQWVQPGTHFSCLGSDMEGKQELDPQILADACLVVDDRYQAETVGEPELAIRCGILTAADIRGEIGEIISGLCDGRRSPEEITVFDSSGIALQDIAAGALAFQKADELGIGEEVEF